MSCPIVLELLEIVSCPSGNGLQGVEGAGEEDALPPLCWLLADTRFGGVAPQPL